MTAWTITDDRGLHEVARGTRQQAERYLDYLRVRHHPTATMRPFQTADLADICRLPTELAEMKF